MLKRCHKNTKWNEMSNSVLEAKFGNVFINTLEWNPPIPNPIKIIIIIEDHVNTNACEQLFSLMLHHKSLMSHRNLQVSIPISIGSCASKLDVKRCDCTTFGTRY